METGEYLELKERMRTFAWDINNKALFRAVGYSECLEDLRSCVKQAYGCGSQRFIETYKHILEQEYPHGT